MADPLSITASIVAVLQAGGALAQGIEKISAARNAPKEVALLREDIARLEAVISTTQSHLEAKPRLDRQAERFGQLMMRYTVANVPLHSAILRPAGQSSFQLALATTTRAEINASDAFGMTPLAWTTKLQEISQVREMLAKGADPDWGLEGDRRPNFDLIWSCFLACSNHDEASLQLLLVSGGAVYLPRSRYSLLSHAIEARCSLNVLQIILDYGECVQDVDEDLGSPLWLLSSSEWLDRHYWTEVFWWLVAQGADLGETDALGDSILARLLRYTNCGSEVVQTVLEQHPHPLKLTHVRRGTILHAAAKCHDPAVLSLLERDGVEIETGIVDGTGETAEQAEGTLSGLWYWLERCEESGCSASKRNDHWDAFHRVWEYHEERCRLEAVQSMMDGALLETCLDVHVALPGAYLED